MISSAISAASASPWGIVARSLKSALPWRFIGLAAMAASLAIGGCQYGEQRVQAKWDKANAAATEQSAQTEVAQAQVTTQVVTKYVDRIQVVRQRGADIIKEVPVYVPDPTDPTACALPGSWRVFHDAASQGELPDPASRADAPPVSAQDAATTVAENYSACYEVSEQLTALQQWLREQQAASARQPETQ